MKERNNKETGKKRINLTVRTICEIGLMAALLEVGKMALAVIPNVEVVSLFIILFTLYLGPLSVIAVFAFIGMECLVWGVGLWTITYIYIWPILVIVIMIVGKGRSLMTYSFISGLYGLFFGAFCSIPFLFMGGPKTAFGMWIAGIPFDMIHGAGNFIICLILFKPLNTLLTRIKYHLDEMSV